MTKLMELHRVIRVAPAGAYRLWLTFDDGTSKEIDMQPWLNRRPLGIFEPLLEPAYFSQVTVDPVLGTIVWPNGADLCPDVLYAYPEPVEIDAEDERATADLQTEAAA